MSVNKEESLTPDELRQKLYQTFKSRGVLDTLKKQLRNQLIQELQQPLQTGLRSASSTSVKNNSVFVKACNSVLIDHLKSMGYEYTLSVFYPESGINQHQVFSSGDLLQLMKITPHMPLYKAVMTNIQKGQTGFLMSLFSELVDHQIGEERRDAVTQTSDEPTHKQSLVEKMQKIEDEYEVLRNRGDRWTSLEMKINEHRKEIEEQSQMELNSKLQHFMDVEITKIKREEHEKSRKEIQELKRDLERTYQMKSEALMNREKNAIQRLQNHQEIQEKEMYTQRQLLLKDIESIRNRENEIKHRTEAFDKTCKLHEEKMKTLEDLLRRRELSVKNMEDSFDQKLKNELMKYQQELKEDYNKRTRILTENEEKNKVEMIRLQKESAVIDAKSQEHQRLSLEVKRLMTELATTREQMFLLAHQKQQLDEKLEKTKDYSQLKKQTLQYQTNITLLKQQLEEQHEENQKLRRDVKGPSLEEVRLQSELERVQTARKRDEEEFEEQKKILHTQLQHEIDSCNLLKVQLSECEDRVRLMKRNGEDLNLHVKQTQQALENEILRNPKSSLLDFNPDKVLSHVRRSDDGLFETGTRPSSCLHHDSEVVSGALIRIRELELEAERLEEAYRNHRQRMVPSIDHYERLRTVSSYIGPTSIQTKIKPHQTPPKHHSSPDQRSDVHQITPPNLNQDWMKKTDAERPSVMLTDLRSDRQISPIRAEDSSLSKDVMMCVSSPTMKSTTRHHNSPPKLQQMISSSSSSSSQESSPPPEKINLHDLTEPEPCLSGDQECLLEKVHNINTEIFLNHEAVRSSDIHDDEDEKRSPEREDLEIHHEEEEEEDHHHHQMTPAVVSEDVVEEVQRESDVNNPLEKYMTMLMQEKQNQSPKKESEHESPHEIFSSEINDDSIDAVSCEEPDEDFW